MFRIFVSLVLFAFCIGCSTVETHHATVQLDTLRSGRYQLLVRSGNAVMDHLLYEMVYDQFSQLIPLKEREPYSGTMEVTFASSSQSAFLGASSSVGNASGSGWYTKSGYVGGTATANATSVTAGSVFTWQNSTMIAVLRNNDGDRLWTADYNYKGGWELSGWVVNTPEEAARLVSRRLAENFRRDFQIP